MAFYSKNEGKHKPAKPTQCFMHFFFCCTNNSKLYICLLNKWVVNIFSTFLFDSFKFYFSAFIKILGSIFFIITLVVSLYNLNCLVIDQTSSTKIRRKKRTRKLKLTKSQIILAISCHNKFLRLRNQYKLLNFMDL